MFYFSLFVPLFAIAAYFKWHPQFGGKFKSAHARTYERSPQWNGKKFINAVPTTMDFGVADMPKLLREQFKKENRQPKAPLHVEPFDLAKFTSSDAFSYIWYGHSAFLMRMAGINFAIDPMMGPDTSPIGPMRSWRFSKDTLNIIEEWPELDAVLYTHDHYDHIDYASFLKLKGKVKHWIVSLGVGRHLERWGIPSSQITELDWWEKTSLGSINVTLTPSRHFSGRGPTDRAKSFWGGFALNDGTNNIYFTGDGGYSPQFVQVGAKLGPFDLCFTESGQYNPHWHAIHMYPEESVQAALDSQSAKAVPYHWGGFRLALHNWTEPAERFVQAAREKGLPYNLPRLGAVNRLDDVDRTEWWREEE